ncbi:hypothetical protein [Mycoplasma feriruminatoris]|uniref:Uncharacterized protein n=1 Tax=Mycoplasma feriruminatoris TaxID=1179777 RepID=A0A654IMT6_9MOLU|nr:hypothetical protein [Mycoplasma feriruminatoris]WFQ92683.1 hypothetical protein MFERI14822_00472 [Mycoplasma feriruminatoris]WFQ93872.1 hypothetical protein MFERI15181_00793 [Mycoplasma feriruminatoris]VZR97390.1 hypothetical protein MF5295_00289 [Mycoplasma feriruminatoris]VZR99871.1 hypothetical protein MF5582_00306 [Mycoplasma feriruminatoris]
MVCIIRNDKDETYLQLVEEIWEETKFKNNETSLFLYGKLKELAKDIDEFSDPEAFSDEYESQMIYIDNFLVVQGLLEEWDRKYFQKIIEKPENKKEIK